MTRMMESETDTLRDGGVVESTTHATLTIDTGQIKSMISEVTTSMDDAVATFNKACEGFQGALYPYHSLLRYEHLKPFLQDISRPICELGIALAEKLPPGPLVGDMLRELWRAKNLAVATAEPLEQPGAHDDRRPIFQQAHLEHLFRRARLQEVGKPFYDVSKEILQVMPQGQAPPVLALLWEAKNLAVAAALT